MDPRMDPATATPQEMYEWLRDQMMPAVREGRAQTCFLHQERCSDTPNGRCAMVALGLAGNEPEFVRDTYKWLAEIQTANKEQRHGP